MHAKGRRINFAGNGYSIFRCNFLAVGSGRPESQAKLTVGSLGAQAAVLSDPSAGSHPASLESTSSDNLFTRIGVRPLLNARGTYTIITGSRSLPQVKQAMLEASNYYVHLDELMPAVGQEIAKLTGSEYAMVTTGCEAAIALATVTGNGSNNTMGGQYVTYDMTAAGNGNITVNWTSNGTSRTRKIGLVE